MPSSPGPEIRVVRNPETLRLIADPLRLRLLELLRREPRTVTELAELLEMPRTNLYYHIGLLEKHDLVQVAESRVVSGITFTMGGILINGRAEALSENEKSIAGLYAAGDAIGGLMGGYRGGYTGGLMQAAVTGLLAGENAAKTR